MNRKETVRIDNLTTGYVVGNDKRVVARDINASLYGGELTCLLGPNGAGKSTLLKTLSCFLPPLSGEILMEGKPLSSYGPSELGRLVGVVLTDRLSLENMTAKELVALGRSPYTGFWGRMSDADREVVDDAIRLVGIADLGSRMVNTLSDGERQKVMIAKALAQETPIIYLDEPTAFLDYPSKVEVMRLLHRLSRLKQKTIFLSTHDLELALQIADKIWLVDKKLGVKSGVPEDLSLEGYVGQYFKRDGLEFDLSAGMFRIDPPISRYVRLTGEGPRANMVRKALKRNGIEASSVSDSHDTVVVTSQSYTYNSRPANTIESLLALILDNRNGEISQ